MSVLQVVIWMCDWEWCRKTYPTENDLVQHLVHNHCWPAAPRPRRDIPLLLRMDDGQSGLSSSWDLSQGSSTEKSSQDEPLAGSSHSSPPEEPHRQPLQESSPIQNVSPSGSAEVRSQSPPKSSLQPPKNSHSVSPLPPNQTALPPTHRWRQRSEPSLSPRRDPFGSFDSRSKSPDKPSTLPPGHLGPASPSKSPPEPTTSAESLPPNQTALPPTHRWRQPSEPSLSPRHDLFGSYDSRLKSPEKPSTCPPSALRTGSPSKLPEEPSTRTLGPASPSSPSKSPPEPSTSAESLPPNQTALPPTHLWRQPSNFSILSPRRRDPWGSQASPQSPSTRIRSGSASQPEPSTSYESHPAAPASPAPLGDSILSTPRHASVAFAAVEAGSSPSPRIAPLAPSPPFRAARGTPPQPAALNASPTKTEPSPSPPPDHSRHSLWQTTSESSVERALTNEQPRKRKASSSDGRRRKVAKGADFYDAIPSPPPERSSSGSRRRHASAAQSQASSSNAPNQGSEESNGHGSEEAYMGAHATSADVDPEHHFAVVQAFLMRHSASASEPVAAPEAEFQPLDFNDEPFEPPATVYPPALLLSNPRSSQSQVLQTQAPYSSYMFGTTQAAPIASQ